MFDLRLSVIRNSARTVRALHDLNALTDYLDHCSENPHSIIVPKIFNCREALRSPSHLAGRRGALASGAMKAVAPRVIANPCNNNCPPSSDVYMKATGALQETRLLPETKRAGVKVVRESKELKN
jgi:hypothetical protein